MQDLAVQTERLRAAFDRADAVLVGAGAGLSTAAGFAYTGERFERHFAAFRKAYGFTDMYSGGFYPYGSLEEFWGFWCRHIFINRYEQGANPLYTALRKLLEGRDYFVITTNVDHQFQLAGFEKQRLFYTQGDYGLFQCSRACTQETYDNEEAIRSMYAACTAQDSLRIPGELVPVCPRCGAPLTTNLRADSLFVEDAGWDAADQRYSEFCFHHKDTRMLYLELGVGFNTPGIVKYPFMNAVDRNPRATYACVNLGQAFAPRQIANRSICIDADIAQVIRMLGGQG